MAPLQSVTKINPQEEDSLYQIIQYQSYEDFDKDLNARAPGGSLETDWSLHSWNYEKEAVFSITAIYVRDHDDDNKRDDEPTTQADSGSVGGLGGPS